MINHSEREDYRDMILKPVVMFENPFYRCPHKLVLCEFWVTMDTPAGNLLIIMLYSSYEKKV